MVMDGIHNPKVLIAEGRAAFGATDLLVVPGVNCHAMSTQSMTLNRVWYQPFFVKTTITLANLVIEVTALAVAGNARLGIYRADRDLQPGALVEDVGVVSIAANAVVTIATTQMLAPDRYLIAYTADGTATLRVIRGSFPSMPLNSLGATPIVNTVSVAKAYAVYADPGTVWDTVQNSNVGFQLFCALDVGAP